MLCALLADGVCPKDKVVLLTMAAVPVCQDEAENIYYSFRTWSEPDDLLTIEDSIATWYFCISKRTVLINHIKYVGSKPS